MMYTYNAYRKNAGIYRLKTVHFCILSVNDIGYKLKMKYTKIQNTREEQSIPATVIQTICMTLGNIIW